MDKTGSGSQEQGQQNFISRVGTQSACALALLCEDGVGWIALRDWWIGALGPDS